jgi:methionyl-tRNA formyltransferase
MGTPQFAVPSLEVVAGRHDVVAVYTRPDGVSGRGSALRPSPVKTAAQALGLIVVQPRTLRDAEVQGEIAAFAPDLIVVAAYGLILPAEVLSIPRFGCVNVHASLLPRWRGAAPIQRAILAGDSVTGVSIMAMEEGLDTGPYCATASVQIGGKDAAQLSAELACAGATALRDALDRLEQGTCEWVSQDDDVATYAPKIDKREVVLRPAMTAPELLRRVRAGTPQAPARATIAGSGVVVLSAVVSDVLLGEGEVRAEKNRLLLGTAEGTVAVVRLKPDGRSEMNAGDWARGSRLSGSENWSEPS